MENYNSFNRRRFLKFSAGLTALGLSGLYSEQSQAIGTGDYKALVCVYLAGGNDGNNMIVPMDATRYAAYKSVRGSLALTGAELLPSIMDKAGNPYALHAGLAEMNPLYISGQLAFVLNTGMLVQTLTRAQFLAGQARPTNLFAHSDQTTQAETGHAKPNGTGWGGRLLDITGETGNLAGISTTHPSLYLQGQIVTGNAIGPGSNLNIIALNSTASAVSRRKALDAVLTLDGGNPIRQMANRMFTEGLKLSDDLKALDNGLTPLATVFPNTALGNQLKEVARQIRLRSKLGPGRQVFYCSLGGFDTHNTLKGTQKNLFVQLSQALSAFYAATGEIGLQSQVTAFTQSEFGRTLQPSGTGCDHGWGSHHMILGGAVRGGVYGAMPEFALGGSDDANNRGVWIPKISTSQFGATLASWFGGADADIAQVFTGLDKFASRNIGFML
jgi:uncharacterized protein (DUF1501 family)